MPRKQDPAELRELIQQTQQHYLETTGTPDVIPLDISDETADWLHQGHGRATVADDDEAPDAE